MPEHPVTLDDLTGLFPQWTFWRGRATGMWSALPPREMPALRLIQSPTLEELSTRIAHALGLTAPTAPSGQRASWRLDEDPWPVRAARRAVSDALELWHVPAWRDDALTVTSELVTNAVSHGAPPITLTLAVVPATDGAGPELVVEVSDASPRPPVRRDPGDDGGFGLTVLHAYAEVTVTPHGHGKVVRAKLHEPT